MPAADTSNTHASTRTTGNPTASATTTNESVQSGRRRPCITGSITWRTATPRWRSRPARGRRAFASPPRSTAPTSGLRANVAKPTTSTPPPDDVEGRERPRHVIEKGARLWRETLRARGHEWHWQRGRLVLGQEPTPLRRKRHSKGPGRVEVKIHPAARLPHRFSRLATPETLQRLAGSDGDHLGWSGGARLPRRRAPLALSRPSGLAQARRAPLALDLSRARRIGNLARLILLARDLRRGAQTRPARCAAWSAAAVFPMRVSHPKEFVVSRPRGALDAAIDRLVKREVALHNGVVHCRRET